VMEVLAAVGDDLDGLSVFLRGPRCLGEGYAACEGGTDKKLQDGVLHFFFSFLFFFFFAKYLLIAPL
jgi:hypothetical protein